MVWVVSGGGAGRTAGWCSAERPYNKCTSLALCFDQLRAAEKEDMTNDQVDLGAKVKSRMRKMSEVPIAVKLKCLMAVLPHFDPQFDLATNPSMFYLAFGVCGVTPLPAGVEFRHERFLITAMTLLYNKGVRAFQYADFKNGSFHVVDLDNYEYITVDSTTATFCLTGQTKEISMKGADGQDLAWTTSDAELLLSACFHPDADETMRIGAKSMFQIGRHGEPHKPISLTIVEVMAAM